MGILTTTFTEELELKGHSLIVSVEASGHIYTENYGADADGNRGEWRTFVDDLELFIRDSRGNDLTDKIDKHYEAVLSLILDMAEEKLLEIYDGGLR